MMKGSRLPIASLASLDMADQGAIGLHGGAAPGLRQALRVVAPICLALVAVIGFNARPALAATTRPFVKSFGSFSAPSGIAIDKTKGNVFIADGGLSETVDIFGPEGEAPSGVSVTEIPGFAFGAEPSGVAVDNSASSPSKGAVYVTDVLNNSVKKFTLNASNEYELQQELNASPGFGEPLGVAVNASGDVFVGDYGSESIIEFSSAGVELLRISTSATVGHPSAVTFDAMGDLYVQRYLVGSVYEYIANGAGEVTSTSSSRQVVAEGATGIAVDAGSETLYVAMGEHVAAYSADGALETEFGSGELGMTRRLAVDEANGDLYVVDGAGDVAVFGPPVIVPTVAINAASDVTGTKATLNGSVNPEAIEVEECLFEYGPTDAYGHTAPCEGSTPADSEPHQVTARVAGLEPNGVTYHYRIVARNANGVARSADRTLTTAATTVTEAATQVGVGSATLNGTVRPEGRQYSECDFEYKLTTESAYQEAPCNPPAATIESDFTAHHVDAALTKLQANSTYEFRLKATNTTGASYGEFQRFTTIGPPQISEVRARDATRDSVDLEAEINPSSFGTSYHFEWGPTASYGKVLPAEFEPYVGNGNEKVRVTAKLTGLSTGSTYHYRVVATSAAGSATSEDAQAETLDSCGLPEARCLEMVSPRNPGPVALIGSVGFATAEPNIHFQSSETPGGLAYLTEVGLPESTSSTEILYKGSRASAGWDSAQYSPGITELGRRIPYSQVLGLSPNLQCGVLWSTQQLTDDPPARLIDEAGGSNLYRRNADGSYTLITDIPPERLGKDQYHLVGMSRDCSHIVFTSNYHYPGVPGAGEARLYEWDEGALHTVGWIPAESGEQPVEVASANDSFTSLEDSYGPVSEDGSRVFFAADRLVGRDPGEVGETGVFVREDGRITKDVSASETSTPDTGATFQGATPDGSRVYFLANAGLTAEASSAGTDLYEYNLHAGTLSDLSVDHEAGGAEAGGENTTDARGSLVGLADDGSRAYFVASGQLVAGHGETLAQNEADETISLYEYETATKAVHFVATVSANKFFLKTLVIEDGGEAVSRVSPDGRYLLFESNRDLTGYETDGAAEAYLYDAEADAESLVCVSCRQDGRPSNYATNTAPRLESATGWAESSLRSAWPRTLVEREGGPLVFFTSHDRLAEGAVEGENNLYEWAHRQVYRVATDLPGGTSLKGEETGGTLLSFAGASADGTDLYFFDAGALNWEDSEARRAAWDARVAGGFAEPAASVSCEPASEASCQGAASPAPNSPPVGSSTFAGPGNLASPGNVASTLSSGSKPLTRTQQLAKALEACRKYKSKSRRLSCERNAHRKYGPMHKAKPKVKRKSSDKSRRAQSHKGGK
jgi:hypothetical protein